MTSCGLCRPCRHFSNFLNLYELITLYPLFMQVLSYIVRFLVRFHGLSDVLHPLNGAANIRVFNDGRLVGDTCGGGVTCRGESRDRL